MNSTGWKKYSFTIILVTLFFTFWGIIISSIYIFFDPPISYIPLPRSFFLTIIWLGIFLWFLFEYYKKRGWEKRVVYLDYKIVLKGIKSVLKENDISYKLMTKHLLSPDIHSFILSKKDFKINLNKYRLRSRKYKGTIVSIGPIKHNNINEIKEIENRIDDWASSRKKTKRASRSEQVGENR